MILLKHKLILFSAMLIFWLCFLGTAVIKNVKEIDTNFHQVIDENKNLANANELLKLVIDMETGVRGHCVTYEDIFLEPYEAALNRFHVLLEEEKKRVKGKKQVQCLKEVEILVDRWITEIAEPEIKKVEDILAGICSPEDLKEMVASQSGKNIVDQIRLHFAKFIEISETSNAENYTTAQKKVTYAIQASIIVFVCSLLFSVIVMGWILKIFGRSVSNLNDGINVIKEGDLEHRIQVLRKDEIGKLTGGFNHMVKRIQEADSLIKEVNTELEQKNTELEHFTYTVSHDLKSPLITVKGFLAILIKSIKQKNEKRIEQSIQSITGAVEKMKILLEAILDLSRVGRLVNPSETIDITQMAQEVVDMFLLDNKNITIKIHPGLPIIKADPIRFEEVLQNLIENSIKYMGDQKRPYIEIGQRKEKGETIIFVKDNGIGIEPAYHDKIWGLFEQLNPSKDGSGVGLALVKRIIVSNGGKIWAESDGLGKGTTISFTI